MLTTIKTLNTGIYKRQNNNTFIMLHYQRIVIMLEIGRNDVVRKVSTQTLLF